MPEDSEATGRPRKPVQGPRRHRRGLVPFYGKVGCCETSVSGYNFNNCYYAGMESALKSACDATGGKWSN